MSPMPTRSFPIPVVALGPGSQPDDDPPELLVMPKDMDTYRPPVLPEPEAFESRDGAVAALHAALAELRRLLAGETAQAVDITRLGAADRALVNQVLGEGEVAAQVTGEPQVRVQESVFAGVWRVVTLAGDLMVRDTIEVGAVPAALLAAAGEDGAAPRAAAAPLPPDAMNAPALMAELEDQQRHWRPGRPAHVLNLTLLPLSAGDSEWLTERLGEGRVVVLSRGYGNCRIVNARMPRTWRVTYFNSQDIVILDTLEVCSIPEVACAARDDLQDSAQRLAEVLDWVSAT